MIATRWYWLGFISCCALLTIAYFYFEKQLGLPPCPLCMFQRVAVAGVGFFCLLGIIIKPKGWGGKILALGGAAFSALGLAIAGRQVWLQNLPEELVPECGPPLDYMLEAFPFMEVIQTVLSGSGECAEIQWQFLGLSMPAWMVIIFAAMLVVCIKLLFIKKRKYFSGALGR